MTETTEKLAAERSWIVDKIADILFDLADANPSTPEGDELADQLKDVASIILDGLNARLISSDGGTILMTVGEQPE